MLSSSSLVTDSSDRGASVLRGCGSRQLAYGARGMQVSTPLPPQLFLDGADDHGGNVDAGGGLDPLEAGGGIHLQQQRPLGGADQVDAGDPQVHGLGGLDGDAPLLGGDLHQGGAAPLVEVGA